MAKIALVFAGQGAQYSGMGEDLYQSSPAAKKIFDMVDVIRPGTSEQCFRATKEELSITENTQPCLFAVDMACGAALLEAGVKPEGFAGFSLGEIVALGFSGMLSYEDAFRLVCKRAQFMQESTGQQNGAMAAVFKLTASQVEDLCQQFQALYPVNYNCPGQIVVAGDGDELTQLMEKVKEQGGKALRLAVSGAFHSPLMNEAATKLEVYVKEMNFQDPLLPVYSNTTAKPYDDAKYLVAQQVKNPVLWQTTIENMIADGFDTFIEAGAGKTLMGLIQKISSDVAVYHVENQATLASTLAGLKEEL